MSRTLHVERRLFDVGPFPVQRLLGSTICIEMRFQPFGRIVVGYASVQNSFTSLARNSSFTTSLFAKVRNLGWMDALLKISIAASQIIFYFLSYDCHADEAMPELVHTLRPMLLLWTLAGERAELFCTTHDSE